MNISRSGWFRLAIALSLLLLSLWAPPVTRQAHAQTTDLIVTIDEVDLSSFPTVVVRASVRNRYGVPIPNLTADNFELVEDGAVARRPSSVNVETNVRAQVSLAIVIDTYRTLEGAPIEAAQQATNNLLNELLNEPNDPDRAAFVAVHRGVSTDPTVIDPDYEVGFTNDRNMLLNVINFLHERIETTGRGTPLYDAIVKAVRLAALTEPVGHRAVIVMTDGEDRDSISTDSDAIQTALNERTPVFTVGLSNARLNEQFLRRLADQTGGTYQAAQTPDDFWPLFNNVLTMLRTQYVLTYESGLPADGGMHSLLLHVRTPTQLEAFQEQRIQMPSIAPAEPVAETETSPTPAPPTPTPTPPAGVIAGVQEFVRNNLLLTVALAGAAGVGFLILIIALVVVMRRRRQMAEAMPAAYELPPIPEVPEYGPSIGTTAPPAPRPSEGEWAGPTQRGPGTGPAEVPVPTVGAMGTPPAFGTTPSVPPSSPPVVPPSPVAARVEPMPAGATRIMDRTPKMDQMGLLIERGQLGRRFEIAKRSVTIGRAPGNDIVIDDKTVSRQHATIKFENGQFRLYDLGSSNGTFVREQRVREPVVLEDGALVRFGGVEFVFKVIPLNP